MLNNSLRVTLLAPGCFSEVTQTEPGEIHQSEQHSTPDVNDAHAISTESRAYEQALAAALQQPLPEMGALPVAQFQYPLDTGTETPVDCVCAELIHLQADRDNARLVPEAALDVSIDESTQLLKALNELVGADNLRVHRSINGHCYFTGMPAHGLDTWPSHAIANGKIASYLPRHAQGGEWRRLMTEVQMLFHAHPVNVARAEQQKLPINSMWFWGGAQINQFIRLTNFVLIADDAYSQGLAGALNVDVLPLDSGECSEHVQAYLRDPLIDELVIVDQGVYKAWLSGDQAGIAAARHRLHEQWITPLQSAVTNGFVSEFLLDGCEGQAIIERQARSSTGSSSLSIWLDKFSLKRFSSKWRSGSRDN